MKYLIIRRFFQFGTLFLFFMGNYSFIEIKNMQQVSSHSVYSGKLSLDKNSAIVSKTPASSVFVGNLSYSKIFWSVPMSDPLSVLQLFVAGSALALDVWIGFFVVLFIYGVFFGRGYCAYVCPINPIVDFANYLRRKLGFNLNALSISRNLKYAILLLCISLSAIFGVAVFDMISPISMLHRGIIFGMGFGIFGVLAVFLFDFLILKNGFCAHLCPLGATFSIIGKYSIFRIKHDVDKCTKCMKCVQICPEKQVLGLIGRSSGSVDGMECIKCGRCIEVCNDDALRFGIFKNKGEKI